MTPEGDVLVADNEVNSKKSIVLHVKRPCHRYCRHIQHFNTLEETLEEML